MAMTTPPAQDMASGGGVTFSVTVTNTGTVVGKEVAQVYVRFPNHASLGEPELVLRKFQKTTLLQPGASTTLAFSLSSRDLSIWNPCTGGAAGL
eukprot:5483121-Prymnesium_polylepis.1